jgi:hypothetical protein
MHLRRVALAATVAAVIGLGAGLASRPIALAQDDSPPAKGSACPRCFKPGPGKFCSDDATALVPVELVGLHLALTKHSMEKEVAPGIPNPLVTLVKADGTVDAERLKKLTADYAEATKTIAFGKAGEAPADAPKATPDAPRADAPKAPVKVEENGPSKFPCRAARRNLVARGGGSIATESAVEAGLKWLARHQSDDGHWSAANYADSCKVCDGTGIGDFDTGLTGLAVLAFLGAGDGPTNRSVYVDAVTEKTVIVGEVVKKGLQYLIDHQNSDGAVGPQVGEMMYNHAIAALALTEAYGMTGATGYKEPAQKAINFLHTAQNYGLAWRYTPKCGNNDTSVTGWCVMALKSAQLVGLEVDPKVLEGAKAWVNRVTDSNGQVGYDRLGSGELYVPGKNENWAHHQTMSGVGLLCRLCIDKKRGDPNMAKEAEILVVDLPKWDPKAARPTVDFYYWYYATYALFQFDSPSGPLWKRWNKSMADTLCQNQRIRKDGCKDGSWDTEGVDRWAYAGGRVYGTALNVLTLEVYYRYPLLLGEK